MVLDDAGNTRSIRQLTYPISSARMVADDNGGVYAFTGTRAIENGVYVYYSTLNKFDVGGTSLLSRRFNDSYAGSIVKIGTDVFITTVNPTTSATTLYKVTINGEISTIKSFGDLRGGFNLVKTADNNLALMGYDNTGTQMVKLTLTGTELWRKKFTTEVNYFTNTPDGGFIMIPFGDRSPILKTDSEGNFE